MDDDDATGGMDGEIFFASIPRASRVARGVGDEAERDGNARVSTSPKGVLKPYSREGGVEGANEGVVRVVCDCESMTDET
jgi:hypothetical protein